MVSLALNTFTEKALRPERHLWVASDLLYEMLRAEMSLKVSLGN